MEHSDSPCWPNCYRTIESPYGLACHEVPHKRLKSRTCILGHAVPPSLSPRRHWIFSRMHTACTHPTTHYAHVRVRAHTRSTSRSHTHTHTHTHTQTHTHTVTCYVHPRRHHTPDAHERLCTHTHTHTHTHTRARAHAHPHARRSARQGAKAQLGS